MREDGLSAWYRYGIEIEQAIPFEAIASLGEEKWQRFCSRRLPQIMEQIDTKRQHYLKLMHRIAGRYS